MAAAEPKFKVQEVETGSGWYWTLIGKNGEVQAVSEVYTTKGAAKRGAEDARRSARTAAIEG